MRFFAALLLAFVLASGAAIAADVPSSVEPSRIGGQVNPFALPETAPMSTPRPPAPVQPAPAGAEEITFVLKGVTVEGMTVYTQEEMKALYAGMLGRKISFADLFAIADAMTAKYRNDGYILSQVAVPEQEIEDGRVILAAVEGFVARVDVKSGSKGDVKRLERLMRPVQRSRPLHNDVLERAVLLAGDLPGLTARTVLGPSKDVPGAADLTLIVERKAFEGFAEANNRGSRYIGPLQANMSVTENGAFGFYEALSLQAASAPDGTPRREMDYLGASWTQPVGFNGATFTLGGNVSRTRPGFSLRPLEVRGRSKGLNAGVSYPILRTRARSVTGNLRFDMNTSTRTDVFGIRNGDRLRVLRGGGTAQFTDPLGGANALNVEFSKGLGILNASEKYAAEATRAQGNPAFFKGTFTLSRTQGLGMFELYTGLTGQKSAHLLLSGEEFGVGGQSFGSAYDSSEITGEDGIATRLELRHARPGSVRGIEAVQYYGFYDFGAVWNPDDAVPDNRQVSLADTGIGFRAQVNEKISASFEAALPLTRPVTVKGDNEPRYFLSLSMRF